MQILQFYKNKKEARRASDQDKAASCQHVGVVCLAALKNKLFPMDYVPGFCNISFGTLLNWPSCNELCKAKENSVIQ